MIKIEDAKRLSNVYRSVSCDIYTVIDQYICDASSHGLYSVKIQISDKMLLSNREEIDNIINEYRKLNYEIEVIEDTPKNYEIMVKWDAGEADDKYTVIKLLNTLEVIRLSNWDGEADANTPDDLKALCKDNIENALDELRKAGKNIKYNERLELYELVE